MLFNLMKKDFLLAKKTMLLVLVLSMGIPIFVVSQIGYNNGTFVAFAFTVFYAVFFSFTSIAAVEYKYKGSALLTTTPYTRNTLVKAKYLFNLLVFMGAYAVYTFTSLLSPIKVPMVSLSTFTTSFLIVAIFLGVFIPMQYKFGYDAIKSIMPLTIVGISFVIPLIIKFMNTNNIKINLTLPFPKMMQDLLPCILAIIIGYISMIISINIYTKKDL